MKNKKKSAMSKLIKYVVLGIVVLCVINFGCKNIQASNIQIQDSAKATAISVSQPTIPSGTYVIESSLKENMVVGVYGNKDENCSDVVLQTNKNDRHQIWYICYVGNGCYTLRNVANGKYLDVKGAGNQSGTNVQIYTSNNTDAQKWYITFEGYCYRITPKCAPDLALDIYKAYTEENTTVQVYSDNAGSDQRFKLISSNGYGKQENHISFDLQGGKGPQSFADYKVSGFNIGRGLGNLIIYNVSGIQVGTNIYGREAAVDVNGKVTAIREYGSDNQLTVPSGGMIVSGHCNAGQSGIGFTNKLKVGDYVGYNFANNMVYAYKTNEAYLYTNKYVSSNSVYGKLPTPSKAGYIFAGWYTAPKGGSKVTETSKYITNKLYAHWVSRKQVISASSVKREYGNKGFDLSAKASGGGKLSYSSNNTKVAKITSDGRVTIKGYGKAIITIKAAPTSLYYAASKEVSITVVPKKVNVKSVLSPSKKKVKVVWKKDKTVSGYEVRVSKDKKFKKETMSRGFKKSQTSTIIYPLKKNERYYVQVRAYKTVGKKKYYGAWSNVKSVKIK